MAGQDWMDKDFYKVLGLSKDAESNEIKKAYRKLSRKYHPDLNQDDKNAEKKYKDITEAYTVLSDKNQREEYDAIRAMGSGGPRFAPGGGAGSFDDLFGGLFNTGQPKTNTRTTWSNSDLPNFDNLFGNTGGFGNTSGFRTQPPLKGADIRATTRISFAGSIRGTQIALRNSDGRVTNVRIPAGVKDGQKIKVRGKGNDGAGGKGDLIVTVKVKPHEVFSRDGNNIRVTVPVTFAEAALGTKIEVPTLNGENITVKIPAGTGSGKTLRLKNKGVKTKKETGDMLVTLEVQVPEKMTKEMRAAVEAYAKAADDTDPRAELKRKAKL
ncbi:MAG: DnaJ C-terminal domain-containing protein [Micrococcaceae bacterium]